MRPVDIVVVSDVHLGTPGCRAAELNAYLKSVRPERLVLCGDIVDFWEFKKGYWPASHMKVVRRILKIAMSGVPVHFITGNHDEALRSYSPFALGELQLCDDLALELDGKRTWFVHGDLVDRTLGTSRLAAWLGALAYDTLSMATNRSNTVRRWFGFRPWTNPTGVFKRTLAASHIDRFERAMVREASERGYRTVICGHIHVPRRRELDDVTYLNSGDWVDSLSALEYLAGAWSVVRFDELVAKGEVESPGPHLTDTAAVA